jgi:hypothetical protein
MVVGGGCGRSRKGSCWRLGGGKVIDAHRVASFRSPHALVRQGSRTKVNRSESDGRRHPITTQPLFELQYTLFTP